MTLGISERCSSAARVRGELPVAVVDVVHDLVQAVEAVFLFSEQLRLAFLRARI